jgi:hypothetical protein
MNTITEAGLTIAGALIALASLSIIISRNSNAGGIIQALASGLGNNIAVATAPVTGTSVTPNLSYPGGGSFANAFGG